MEAGEPWDEAFAEKESFAGRLRAQTEEEREEDDDDVKDWKDL